MILGLEISSPGASDVSTNLDRLPGRPHNMTQSRSHAAYSNCAVQVSDDFDLTLKIDFTNAERDTLVRRPRG